MSTKMLTNAELLSILKGNASNRDQNKKSCPEFNGRDYIEKKLYSYLEGGVSLEDTRDIISNIKKLQLDLTAQEVLQLINNLPSSEVELHAILGDYSARYDDDQVASILGACKRSSS